MTSESEEDQAARLEEGGGGGGGEGSRDRKKLKKKHRSRSMSREKYHDHHHHRRRSRSRSSRRRSRSDSRDRRDIIVKGRSASPRIDYHLSHRSHHHHHQHNRNVPEPNKCLGVFGLSTRTTEKDLLSIFSKYGQVENCIVVMHGQTGRSRGFSFVYFTSVSAAAAAKEACNGMEIDGARVRVDFSITQRAHTPTPGIYMGRTRYDDYSRRRRVTSDYRSHHHHSSYHHHHHRRTPSPYRRGHSRIRSRSRSRSPRRHHHHRR